MVIDVKKVVFIFLTLLLAVSAAAGAAAENPAAQANPWLETVWKAQTIDGLNSGLWIIPEEAINRYFADCAGSYEGKIKNPSLRLAGDNSMYISFDSSVGRVGLTCDIKQFVHNRDESYAEVYVRKKEVADKPVLSWMLKFIPLGAIADLFGNPLKDMNQVDARFSGNTLKVNFHALVAKSLLATEFGQKVEIGSITTREGALELHTNIKATDVLGMLLGYQR